LKHQRYKLSGNDSNSFNDFCYGQLDTYYLHCWLSTRDPNFLDSIVKELPSEVVFESANTSVDNSSFSTGASKAKKWKSTADVLERHLQMKAEAKSEIDVLKSQKAAACQLTNYCLGMDQLVEMSQRSTATLTSDQSELMARMRNTIGRAVSAMESHI
jgi:hypothetical protein